MRSQWYKPRPESSPEIRRDDEITDRILIGPTEKADMWRNVASYEAKMAFATCEDLRRQLRTALDANAALRGRIEDMAEQILKLKGRTK